ncbi:MAG: conjugal transfer protein TraF [Alphaproteobacteria bacterium]|nr:conjugal transfer protein TraF [Alphaproteobacteria bacterium]
MKTMVMFMALLFSAIYAEEKTFYDDHARGWHWYEKIEEEEKEKPVKEEAQNANKYPATAELKEYQAQIEEAKALAVMHPSPKNIFNYQRLQYEMTEKSGLFAEIWMQNIYKNPELDYTQQSPVSQNARHIYLVEKQKQAEEKIKKLADKYGLFFFFKNNCPYCEAFAPILKRFSEKYGWEVLAVSEYGEKHTLFRRSVQDNGLAETWGVNTYPSVFAINPQTGHVIPVAVGMISIQEMEERIVSLIADEAEDAA